MNILHLVDEPYDSGIVHYALTLASAQQAAGHRIHVGGRKGFYPLEGAARRGLDTLALSRLPGCLPCLRSYVAKRAITLIHAHSGSAHTLAVVAARMLRNAPPVVRSHAGSPPIRKNPGAGWLWRRTAGFIGASRKILDQFQASFPKLAIATRMVPLGIPDPYAKRDPAPEPPLQEPLRVGIVARLDPVKGHLFFLRAAARVAWEAPDTVFTVAGREENVKLPDLRSAVAGLGLSKSVEFLGHVPDALEIMQLCHIGVVASTDSEALSRVALEWMASARPLVATAVGNLPEVVIEGRTGLLAPPKDERALAKRLLELSKSRDRRREMGRDARRVFLSRFTPERMFLETEKFYEEAIHPVPSR
ncbi:MAG: glycosyltransferase family 4 protein [Elusimicrobia bacterium]|nr:glycosyltransferase family 4 protein [Elusimicrobiota bacterium]